MIRKNLRSSLLLFLSGAGLLLGHHHQGNAQTVLPAHDSIGAKGSVTFTYRGAPVTYSIVRTGDSTIWLEQNLGSSQVAPAQNNTESYGDLFQWGRWDDGHQLRTSTGVQATTLSANNPTGLGTGLANHITNNGGTVWWSGASTSLDDTWSADPPSATNGLDPCAALGQGWRMPDSADWARVRIAENITNVATGFSSRLKLPAAGYRNTNNANVTGAGSSSLYASSSNTTSTNVNSPVQPWYMYNGNMSSIWQRGNGASCRCIYVPLCDGTPDGGTLRSSKRSVCNGGSFTLSLMVNELTNFAYQWQERPLGDADFTDIPGGVKTTLFINNHQKTTEYRCRVTCTNTMDLAYSDTLAVAILSLPINLGKDTSICEGETITIDAGVGGTDYEWSNGTTGRTITVSEPDVYWAAISNSEGCMGSDTISVSITEKPSATMINAATYGLTGIFSVANALHTDTYEWDFGSGGSGTGPNPVHTYDTAGEYEVTVVLRNECDSNTLKRKFTITAPTTGVGTEAGLADQIRVYPVPAKDVLHINAGAANTALQVQIFDIGGKSHAQAQVPAHGSVEIPVSAWPSGIYILKIMSDSGIHVQRVLVD